MLPIARDGSYAFLNSWTNFQTTFKHFFPPAFGAGGAIGGLFTNRT